MSFLDSLFQALSLRRPEPPSGGQRQLIRQELIKRSSKYQSGYNAWTGSGRCSAMLEELHDQYKQRKDGLDQDSFASIYQTPKASGVFYTYQDRFDPVEFEFMFDLIRDRTTDLKYISYVSDRMIYERPNYFEVVQKHYLKPSFTLNTGPKAHQLYGNILVEHVKLDERPSYLKILATTYSDTRYHDPLPFDEFMEKILATK